jgi:hypothetical protein
MKTWIIAAALSVALSAAGASGAFAQAGSTGGTIGKTDKSVSGGEEAAHPRESAEPDSRPTKPRERENRAASSRSGASVAGQWRWTADCPNGHWNGAFAVTEVSNGQFTGEYDAGAGGGTISNGHVNGGSVSFTRTYVMGTQQWSGHLTSGHMAGSLSQGPIDCRWQASK